MCDIPYDDLGPSKVIHLMLPNKGIRAIVVIDNIARGPAIGGVRISPAVTCSEVLRLARTMTLKNAAAGLAHGGAKSAILADPRDPGKEEYVRSFGRLIRDLAEYIPGPDMGSDEQCMAWLHEETGRAVGLPAEKGGLPLDKLGATGFGLAECADVACAQRGMKLAGSAVAIQGFGSVGKAVARFLAKKGAVVVAAGDTRGAIYSPYGMDVEQLIAAKQSSGSVVYYPHGKVKRPEEIFSLPCDILVPAAAPDVITKENVSAVQAQLILEGANIPVTAEAEEMLHARGVLVVPDFIANAGGVIMAAMEYARKTEQEAFSAIAANVRTNTELILSRSKDERLSPRRVALSVARERVLAPGKG